MKKRWSIWVRQYLSDHDTELIQCDSNPKDIRKGLVTKMVTVKKSIFEGGKRKSKIPLYSYVYIVDNETGQRVYDV